MIRLLLISTLLLFIHSQAKAQKGTKITYEYIVESWYAFPDHIAFGGNVGYLYNNLSFFEVGGGVKAQLSNVVLGAGYNIEMNFDRQLNNNKFYFELGYNYGLDFFGTFNYLKLNELQTNLADEVIRAEIGIGAPLIFARRGGRGKISFFAHFRVKYGYNFLLKKQTGADLGNHSFNVSVLIGGAFLLKQKIK